MNEGGFRITPARALAILGVIAVIVALAVVLLGRGDSEDATAAADGDAQTVSFQQPEDPGPDPFTEPADVEGGEAVELPVSGSGGSQPFGGSGSNRVCDRDKLIRFLRANPDRMRAWARALGIDPTFRAVRRYIAKLHPVTLTRDTRVTNHAFKNGVAVPFQAILQAGTAVLVDKYGTPVVRCFCGNPLKPAVFVPTAKCTGCPANYKPPKQCEFGRRDDYDETYYRRSYYGNAAYDEVFIRRHRRSRFNDCYEPYPDPPTVTIVNVFRRPEPEPEPEPAQADPTPHQVTPHQVTPEPYSDELQCDPPRSQLEFELCAALEHGEPAPAPEPQHEPELNTEPTPPQGVDCNAPQSQLEFEQCAGFTPTPPEEQQHTMP